MAGLQISPGIARDLHPIYLPHLLPYLPDGYRALDLVASSPRYDCLICGFCSSGRDFACGFLRTSPRGNALAVRLTVPTIRVRRGLTPPSRRKDHHDPTAALTERYAPCRAHNARGHRRAVPSRPDSPRVCLHL